VGCWSELERVDAELSVRAREEAAFRLRLGQVLEALSLGGCFALGFSSIGAYALERGERSVRWVESVRCLARRLEGLPQLRKAVAAGRISWSMGELLGRVASPQDEADWLQRAQGRTLREMRLLCEAAGVGDAASDAGKEESAVDEREPCMLTFTVDREDAWLFEATRALLEALGTRAVEEQVEALLAEGQDALLAALPRGTLNLEELECLDPVRERWLEQLRRWRQQAEALCDQRIRSAVVERGNAECSAGSVAAEAALGAASLEGKSAEELDGMVRSLVGGFAAHELELARLILRLHQLNGWRRLGYATEGQYARERLGMSRSSLLSRRALAVRLERLPQLTAALGQARIGVEAALQIARIATPQTEVAWVERARQRTVKHLREEVAAALTAVRLSGEQACPPPFDAELAAFQELERAVVSGRVCQNSGVGNGNPKGAGVEPAPSPPVGERSAWAQMLHSLECWLERGVQFSAAGSANAGKSSAGRITLRLRVARSTRAWWHALEAQSLRWRRRGMSWLKFLCLNLWRSWQHLLGVNVAYGRIYIRDRHRCSSPVCSRRDVTPHHLKFRSAGGGEEDENLASLCTWCHLFGVHGGRIRARGTAQRIHWELGSPEHPCLRVDGRERRAA
jgi:hypothetical protein